MSGGLAVAGEKNGRHVLTEADVRMIRMNYQAGGITMTSLAEQYAVSEGTIRNVIHYRTWNHV